MGPSRRKGGPGEPDPPLQLRKSRRVASAVVAEVELLERHSHPRPLTEVVVKNQSKLDRTVAFYPGPAGATESELPLEAWGAVLARNPALGMAAPDTEALLIRGPGPDRAQADCHLVPVDACYELRGTAAPPLAGVRRRAGGPRTARRVLRPRQQPQQTGSRG